MALTKITGQVVDTTTDLVVGVTTVGGGVSAVDGFFSGIVTFSQGVSIGGTLTYEDVTNIDSVGLITARNGIVVGSGITLSKDGDAFFTGVTTSTTFVGALTGNVTGNVTGNISGGTVAGSTGTFTGDVDIADKIIHTGDTNTAIRFPEADTITAETSGSERLRITSDGQLITGATSIDSSALISLVKDTTEVLADDEPLYNNASPAFLTVYNSNNTGSGEEAGINIVPAGSANGAISIYGKKTGSYAGDLIFRFRSGASTSAERLRIDNKGRVTTPYQVAFCASGDASNLDIDPGDKIAFNTLGGGGATINTNRTTYGGTNVYDTTNYQFTAPVAGLYLFTVSFYMRALNGSNTTQFILAINGTEVNHQNHMLLFSVYAVEGLQPNGTQILDLSANDVVTVHRRTAGQTGTSRVYMPHSYFQGCLIG